MNMGGSDPVEGHTAKAFDAALSDLRLQIVGMGGLVIDQVSAAVRALLDGDAAVADLVLSRENKVNELERFVDREAFRLIALHQPMASDLRMAKAASRITVELERAGDEAKKIAKFAARVATGEPQGPVLAVARFLRHMAELTTGMLRDAVRSLDESNAEMASAVRARDSELDDEFAAALRQILTLAMQDARFLGATIDTVFALKGLERIGDHAKNIAEQVLFVASGEDVRHTKKAAEAGTPEK
ncbi:phosphate transport system regulatory protein PhoU [Steroidobacter agaridevorans]|uniref:Phosphate-specific transport system accessory protein PhoU n=1 Tax=Steroidobacter agaridevorans TaxID=2695856 RepID=A0A829YDI7_9GAMM|nr:phosphate signaling complex protein PhoU [Steroidobacter agaridevorans]GFE80732.1 phosphate transport system regulatory protein PhoU [Steroidobacter agaridevorans]GFE87833.1 phosphate transport system regulatory protein PhoU [Steroidobacter agaridevorans]